MKITLEAQQAFTAIEMRAAKVTQDIDAAEVRAKELEPEAERSESARKAMSAIRAGIERAKKIREQLAAMDRALRGVDVSASVELNDNECSVLSYVDLR